MLFLYTENEIFVMLCNLIRHISYHSQGRIYVESPGSRDPDGFLRIHYTYIFSPAMTPVKKYDDPGVRVTSVFTTRSTEFASVTTLRTA